MRNARCLWAFAGISAAFWTSMAIAEPVPEIPGHCYTELNAGRECLVSQVRCDNLLCFTGEFYHELYIRVPRAAIGTKADAIRKITRYELWPESVLRRDPAQSVMRVHQSIKGPFTYDDKNELLEAIQYADFEANSPIGWQPMTMVNRFGIVEPSADPSYGQTFLTTRVHVDTQYNVGEIGLNLPWSRGIKYMDGFLHLIEEAERSDSMIAVYSHRLRVSFDLAPMVAQQSITDVIRTITGALIDIMTSP